MTTPTEPLSLEAAIKKLEDLALTASGLGQAIYSADILAITRRALSGGKEEPNPWDEISREKALARWILQDHEAWGLNPDTAKLVRTFAGALAQKLREAEKKYGYSDGWKTLDWEAECQRQLLGHVQKGDPLDVAAYAAFCWGRRWSTAPDTPSGGKEGDVEALIAEAQALHLRSTTNQHAKLLDDWSQRVSPVSVPAQTLKIVLALIEEHEALNRRLADALARLRLRLPAEGGKKPDLERAADRFAGMVERVFRDRAGKSRVKYQQAADIARAIRIEAKSAAPSPPLTLEADPTEGWALVPREPRVEMVAAFWQVKNTGTTMPGEWGDDRSDYAAYRAMIAAAPTPPEGIAPPVGLGDEP